MEKSATTTDYFLSKSIKLSFFSLINQGIIPLIIELYNKTNGYEHLIINISAFAEFENYGTLISIFNHMQKSDYSYNNFS